MEDIKSVDWSNVGSKPTISCDLSNGSDIATVGWINSTIGSTPYVDYIDTGIKVDYVSRNDYNMLRDKCQQLENQVSALECQLHISNTEFNELKDITKTLIKSYLEREGKVDENIVEFIDK